MCSESIRTPVDSKTTGDGMAGLGGDVVRVVGERYPITQNARVGS